MTPAHPTEADFSRARKIETRYLRAHYKKQAEYPLHTASLRNDIAQALAEARENALKDEIKAAAKMVKEHPELAELERSICAPVCIGPSDEEIAKEARTPQAHGAIQGFKNGAVWFRSQLRPLKLPDRMTKETSYRAVGELTDYMFMEGFNACRDSVEKMNK